MITASAETSGRRGTIWRRLTHRYTWAIVLIALLVVTLLFGALVPQSGQVTAEHFAAWQAEHPALNSIAKTFGLDDLVTSWWALLLATLMAMLLGYDFVIRLRGITRSGKKVSKQAFKTRMGIYGSLFFHLCLITIFVGAAIDLTFGYHGTVFLSEGQAERDTPEAYAFVKNGLIGNRAHKGFVYRMTQFDPNFTDYGIATDAALMRFFINGNLAGERWIAVNHPASVEGVRMYFRDEVGYTPHLEIYDTAGTPVYRSFVRLAAQRTAKGIHHGDYILLRDNRQLYCSALPDSEEGMRLDFQLNGDDLHAASLSPPGNTICGDLRIHVKEVRRWARFELSCHPGEPVVFAGLWGAIVGLTWRFAFPQPRKRETGS